jgi:hypothetical protein
VSESVVDTFEVVDVNHHDREIALLSRANRLRVLEAIGEESAVGNAGQPVVESAVAQFDLETALLGYIARQDQRRAPTVDLEIVSSDLDVDDPPVSQLMLGTRHGRAGSVL